MIEKGAARRAVRTADSAVAESKPPTPVGGLRVAADPVRHAARRGSGSRPPVIQAGLAQRPGATGFASGARMGFFGFATRNWSQPLLLLASCLALLTAGPLAAAQLDGPRPAGHVLDTVGLLAPEDIAAIERVAEGVAAASGGDLMVVVTATTGGQPHRAYATALFNRWQLGSAERNDGLLIFVALDDRKAEIVLGDGIDDNARERASQRIMDRALIPEFKAGRPAAGLRKAALACAAEILGGGPEAAIPDEPEPTIPPAVEPEPAAARAPPAWNPPQPRNDPLSWIPAGVATAGCSAAGMYFLAHYRRHRRRSCPSCRIDLVRLGEEVEDEHLTAGQQTEERLGAMDYDVWTCPTCPHVTKLRYKRFFSSFATCRGCGYRTRSKTVERVREPTSTQSGLETITESCHHCGKIDTSTRVIPQHVSSDDAFWSGSSFGGGSSFGSSDSGGGSSSGGGASGSW